MNSHTFGKIKFLKNAEDDCEYRFARCCNDITWRSINYDEFERYRDFFEKKSFSSNIFRAVLLGILLFVYFTLLLLYMDIQMSAFVISAAFLCAFGFILYRYINDGVFLKNLLKADVCFLPVYRTLMRSEKDKDGIRHEQYYAVVFDGYRKTEIPVTMSDITDITDIMFVNVDDRTEYMPVFKKENCSHYRKTGIFRIYDMQCEEINAKE